MAVDDSASTPKNVPVTIDPLANDSDPDGDALTIISVSPTNGAASIIGGTNVLFTPNASFTGTATVGYTISDGGGGTASALITLSLTNPPPLPAPTSPSPPTTPLPPRLSPDPNDSAPAGDALTITSASPPSGAGSIIGGTNVLSTPNPGFPGTATVVYTTPDGGGGPAGGLIPVGVTTRPPMAV